MSNDMRNFTQPTYALFLHDVAGAAVKCWQNMESSHKFPAAWLKMISQYGSVTYTDIALVVVLAIIWTLCRYLASNFIFRPLISLSGLSGLEALKAPESAWKCLVYSCTWSYSIYILFFTENNYFHDVASTFTGWKIDAVVPFSIYIAYMVQISFYVHSVYATLFIDVWRKDSIVMLLHHFVTMFLISFSYIFRYTKVGILILFLHDITDVILEGTKLFVYYKTKGGYWYKICDALSTVGFIMFGVTWFIFRLYWFPLKAIYAAGYISQEVTKDLVFYPFFNILLWILLMMNIYWFKFIVLMAYRILTNQMAEVDDVREYDEKSISVSKKKN